MILYDMNRISVASFMAQGKSCGFDFDENLVRHIILSVVKSIKFKLGPKYGKPILCYDSSRSWRSDYFPYYKASRKTSHKESVIDWNALYTILNKIRDEMIESFPYPVMLVDTAEADDIIAYFSINSLEETVIVSGDKDFRQLHRTGIKQYDPVHKKDFITEDSPGLYLEEHIIKGDESDGIPNIRSDDDTFVNESKGQFPINRVKMYEIISHYSESGNHIERISFVWGQQAKRNYYRNKKLIDLRELPSEVLDRIGTKFQECKPKSKNSFINYLISNKMNLLLEDIHKF